jgi:RNA methyltransferase, TrmH family
LGDPGTALVKRFAEARSDRNQVVLEGLHALKHALRFGARIEIACAPDLARLLRLTRDLAPDLPDRIGESVREVADTTFAALAPVPPPTGVIAIAARPAVDPAPILAVPLGAPVVLLENPAHLGNLGAVVRTAAAADAGAVLVTGCDPWHPAAVRGSAGLHFALPVARLEALPATPRRLLAIDPDGEPLTPDLVMDGAILAFGSERHGLGKEILARADRRIAIPMRAGVSSLNLATAVAVVLYAWRLAQPDVRG